MGDGDDDDDDMVPTQKDISLQVSSPVQHSCQSLKSVTCKHILYCSWNAKYVCEMVRSEQVQTLICH